MKRVASFPLVAPVGGMSQSNLSLFLQAVAKSPDLQAKLQEIKNQLQGSPEDRLAALSVEIGTPVKADEFQGLIQSGNELPEFELENVAGGRDVLTNLGDLAKVGVSLLKSLWN